MAADQIGITTVPGQQLQFHLPVQPQMQPTLPVQPQMQMPMQTTLPDQPPMQTTPHAQPPMPTIPHAQPQMQPTSPQQLLLSALDLIRHAMQMIEYATSKL